MKHYILIGRYAPKNRFIGESDGQMFYFTDEYKTLAEWWNYLESEAFRIYNDNGRSHTVAKFKEIFKSFAIK